MEVVVVTEAEIESDLRAAIREAIEARSHGRIVECPWHFCFLALAEQAGMWKPGDSTRRNGFHAARRAAERFPKLAKLILKPAGA